MKTAVPTVVTAQVPRIAPSAEVWIPQFFLDSGTRNVDRIAWHVSQLAPGSSPHVPHTHEEEELLILLSGTAWLELPGLLSNADKRLRLESGDIVFYPAGFPHTIANDSDQTIQYTMLRWSASRRWRNSAHQPEFRLLRRSAVPSGPPVERELSIRPGFDFSTRYLSRLECHVSDLEPGGGYDAHVDAHDVAVLVLRGRVEIMGEGISAPGIAYVPARSPHDMRNPGTGPARYIVFEFHGLPRRFEIPLHSWSAAARALARPAGRWVAKQWRRSRRLAARLLRRPSTGG